MKNLYLGSEAVYSILFSFLPPVFFSFSPSATILFSVDSFLYEYFCNICTVVLYACIFIYIIFTLLSRPIHIANECALASAQFSMICMYLPRLSTPPGMVTQSASPSHHSVSIAIHVSSV